MEPVNLDRVTRTRVHEVNDAGDAAVGLNVERPVADQCETRGPRYAIGDGPGGSVSGHIWIVPRPDQKIKRYYWISV